MIKYCPCGSKMRYMDCCGLYITNKKLPDTPEALMRSRYTAFAENNMDYIKKTMKPPASLAHSVRRGNNKHVKWIGLDVLNAQMHLSDPTIGFVEFKAKFREKGLDGVIHENSEFHFINDRWFYVDGSTPK
jgi:SEC-C motif-containing protein